MSQVVLPPTGPSNGQPTGPVFNSDAAVDEGSYPLPGDPRLDTGPGPSQGDPETFVADPSFFGWLRGRWTLDLEGSALPPLEGLELAETITLTFDKLGGFFISAPKVVVRHPLGEFVAALEAQGSTRIGGHLDEAGRVPMQLEDFRFTKRDFEQSKWSLPFDPTFAVNAIFDLLTARAPPSVMLATSSAHGEDALVLSSGGYGHRLVRPSIRCRVEALTFLNEHGAMRELAAVPLYRDAGRTADPPHWTSAGVAKPVSYTRGTTIHAEATVTVARPGEAFRLFGISKTFPWLNFESAPMIATGLPQKTSFHGKGVIPPRLGARDVEILWNVQFVDDQLWYHAGVSGPHRIHVTHAAPILTNSCGNANAMTPKRMNFIARILAPFTPDAVPEIADVAPLVQHAVNNYRNDTSRLDPSDPLKTDTPQPVKVEFPIVGHPASTLNPDGRAKIPDNVWGLLDVDNVERGNCGEATMLMEQIFRLLGWRATQTHVYASTKIDVLRAGMNVRRSVEGGADVGEGPEKRQCLNARHTVEEELCMSFGRSGANDNLAINAGEGCVEVEGRLYSGLLPHVATAEGGRTAPHNMLRQLQQLTQGAEREEDLACRFQIWCWDDAQGTHACECGPPDWNNPQQPFGEDVPE
ncbi:MAG: hypothetical protein J7515_12610 [Caulobacter sp.]|nr:hypothetical protein [Caulobacter sp.]